MVSIYLYTKICSSFYQCNSCYCSRFTLWADEECTFNMKTGCPFQINIQEIVFISKSENTIGPWSLENIEFFTRNCIGSIFLWLFFFLYNEWYMDLCLTQLLWNLSSTWNLLHYLWVLLLCVLVCFQLLW